MANAEQVKALIKSHYTNDTERFTTLALQVAAAEAKKGHNALAGDIRKLVERGKKSTTPLRLVSSNNHVKDLLHSIEPRHRLSALVAHQELRNHLERILHEFRQRTKLEKYGLSHRRKILLTGPPGTGKTMTANVIAHELNLPLYIIHTDRLITKYMGETASKLRYVFEYISSNLGVYFFDEFDAIGAERARDNDVGEMRRILNSFLQFLEEDSSPSFLLAATNHIAIIDQALFRRFDDILIYELPSHSDIVHLVKNRLANFTIKFNPENIPVSYYRGLSHSEVTQACDDAIKFTILGGHKFIKKDTLLEMLKARKRVYDLK